MCILIPRTGLGHRLTNVMGSMLLAEPLGALVAKGSLVHTGKHGEYSGANDLFQLPEPHGEMPCGTGIRKPSPNPASFSRDHLPGGIDQTMQDVFLHTLNTNESNYCTVLKKVRDKIVEREKAIPAGMSCNTIYQVPEYWPASYDPILPTFRKYWRGDDATNANVQAQISKVKYNAKRFNLAVHIRNGDIVPTPLSYFPAVLKEVLGKLGPLRKTLPLDVWVFAENLPASTMSELAAVLEEGWTVGGGAP